MQIENSRLVAAAHAFIRRIAPALVVVVACLASTGCAWNANAAPGSTSIDSAPNVIAAEWDGNLPVVSVYLNSAGPYRFLLDTGVGSTRVSHRCAREAKLALFDANVRIDAAGAASDHEMKATTIDSLRLGDALFSNVSAVVFDTEDHFDGVLGFPVFADVLLTIDGPAGRIVLERGRLPSPDSDPDCLPLQPGDVANSSPRVRGRVADRPALILIDSGFDGFLYLAGSGPDSIDLDFRPDPDGAATALTLAGRREVHIGRLHERIDIASLAFENVPTIVGMGPPVILGGEFLRGVVTTFDQRSGRVRFSRAER
jgi:hypothetical protein